VIQFVVMAFLAWLRKVQHALHECAESIRYAQERKRKQQMPSHNDPLKVEAIVSFDQKTVTDAVAQNKESNATQKSIKCATWAAFGAVAVYAIVTTFMWCAMLEQNKIARTALVSGQRAYVNFSPSGEIATRVERGKVVSWSASVPITNSGETPTANLLERVNVYPSQLELPNDFTFPDDGKPDTDVLAPKQTVSYEAKPIPIEKIQAVQNGTGHVYIYGWVSYNDQFPKTLLHRTEFCYQLRLNSLPGDVTDPKYNLQGKFMTCHRHNCADKGCDKNPN
jgi:hypothetical protein